MKRLFAKVSLDARPESIRKKLNEYSRLFQSNKLTFSQIITTKSNQNNVSFPRDVRGGTTAAKRYLKHFCIPETASGDTILFVNIFPRGCTNFPVNSISYPKTFPFSENYFCISSFPGVWPPCISSFHMSWKIVSQLRTCSSTTSVSIAAAGPSDDTMFLSWQNAADDDLRRRPADCRRPGMREPCRTVTRRPKWPS